MEVTQRILAALLPIAIGLFFRLIGLFGEREGELLRKFVVRFTVPIFVFFSVLEARADSLAAIGPMISAFVLMTLVLFSVGWVVAGFYREGPRRAAVHACITLGNYGWMGLGVAHALLGEPGAQRVVYFILLWWPVFYIFGLSIGFIHVGGRKGAIPVRHALLVAAPPIAALGLGLLANVAEVRVPVLLGEVLRPFGEMTVPLILLSVGLLLDFRSLGREVAPALVISAVALVVGPLVGLGLAALVAGGDETSFAIIVLEGAMPVATLTPLLEENYQMDKDLVSTAIVLSTALSLVTVPLVGRLLLG